MRPKLAVLTSLVQDNIPAPLECCEKLYIGSIHAAFNVEKMKELGITHIVNASGLPPTYPKMFTYLTVDVRDKNYAPILGCIPAANIFIEAGLDEGGGVLVHCAGGRSRSAAIIAAFLMSTMKLSIDEAIAECLKARDLVSVNPGFQIQLHAYGAANCDVHSAHQILIHKRLERFGEKIQQKYIRDASESKDGGEAESSKFDAKVEALLSLLDSASNATQPRLRLSRPASQAVQVIPPLRALERVLSCRRCAAPLFSYANVVLLNTNHTSFDHKAWARDYVQKTSKGPQPFLALNLPAAGDDGEDEGMNESHDGHRNGGGRDNTHPNVFGDNGPPTFSGKNGGGFGRGESKRSGDDVSKKRGGGFAPAPAKTAPASTSPATSSATRFESSSSKMTDDNDVDQGRPASPPIIPALNFSCGNRYDIRRNSHTLQQQHQSLITPEASPLQKAEAKEISPKNGVPTRSYSQRGSFTAPELALSSLRPVQDVDNERDTQNSARSVSSSSWSTPPDTGRGGGTPRSNFRPQSAEKQRWLRRLQVLEHPSYMIKAPVSEEGGGGGGDGRNLKLSERVQQLAVADEECQKALHSQVLNRPWRAIHQQYREAVEELTLPESPLKVASPMLVDHGRASSSSTQRFTDNDSLNMVTSDGNGPKAFFLEPMEWMDLETVLNGTSTEGCLTCPGCRCEVGSWMWDKPTSESSILVPRFAVMRRFVVANALPSENPSSRDSTPRDSIDGGGSEQGRIRTRSGDMYPMESPRVNSGVEGGSINWSPESARGEPKEGISPRLDNTMTESKKACEDD